MAAQALYTTPLGHMDDELSITSDSGLLVEMSSTCCVSESSVEKIVNTDIDTNRNAYDDDRSLSKCKFVSENSPHTPSKQDIGCYASRVIKKLKRYSDAWSSAGGIVRSRSISSMLKQRQEEATVRHKDAEVLLTEASAQLQIHQQACSVLKHIRQGGSLDEVEAERLILLSGERYKLYKCKAEQIVCEFRPAVKEERSDTVLSACATLYISDIQLALAEEFVCRMQKSSECPAHHFICLLNESKTLGTVATQIVSLCSMRPDRKLEFSNRLTIPEVSSDFELDIEVYHMASHYKVNNRKRMPFQVINSPLAHMQKRKGYGLKKCLTNLTCTSTSTTTDTENFSTSVDLRASQFQFLGKVHISKETLHINRHHLEPSAKVVDCVQLSMTADPDISHLFTEKPIQGYLSVFRGSWRREWFVLKGTHLCSWAYPDQPVNMEKPLTQWDLCMCSKLVYVAASDVCAWQNAFLLPLPSEELLLAADSSTQLEEWMSALNMIIIVSTAWEQ